MKKDNKIILLLTIGISLFLISTAAAFPIVKNQTKLANPIADDLDPLVDLQVIVDIKTIRSLEKFDQQIPSIKKINWIGKPNFYVKVFINGNESQSPIWEKMKYVYQPDWSATLDVPDDQEWVTIRIELWDHSILGDKMCDLTGINEESIKEDRGINLTYSLKTGHWYGDDNNNPLDTGWWMMTDDSGYGRLNGCDDRSIYQQDPDCELWFNIHQNDFDGDGIPCWAEMNVTHTDPAIDNRGQDADGDGCPIEWEFKWGHFFTREGHSHNLTHAWAFDDSVADDHQHLDADNDGLSNYEEYQTSQWGSDPFRKDLFVELDQMATGPNGEESIFPDASKELISTAFNRRNIVFHLDDGTWQGTGSDTIPFQNATEWEDLDTIYVNYFLQGNEDNWRQGVFHYGVLVYNCTIAGGNAFGSNAYQVSSKQMDKKSRLPLLQRDVVYASAYMHECGHTLITGPLGGHDDVSKYPWQLGWWKWRPYRSCMNYGYTYKMVDYSDGSQGKNDFNDWSPERMDLTAFQHGFFQ
jgi:hypothetical protein